jgi:hypothetical protein
MDNPTAVSSRSSAQICEIAVSQRFFVTVTSISDNRKTLDKHVEM